MASSPSPSSSRDRLARLLPVPTAPRLEELEAYARALDLADPGGDHLPDGESLARCTNGAAATVERYGGRVVGYATEDNPTATVGADIDGHDFALVDEDRFLVDPWGALVAMETPRAVFDLLDPADAAAVRILYGDRMTWRDLPDVTAPEWTVAFNAAHRAAATTRTPQRRIPRR